MTEKYNLIVVGAGPGGSHTARIARKENKDLDVLVLERGEEPAADCAGGLGVPFWKHVGFKPPDHVIERPVRDIYISSENEEWSWHMDQLDDINVSWTDEEVTELGWLLDRQKWDNYQLDLAKEQGAEVRTKHTVQSVKQNGDVELEVLDRNENAQKTFKADYVALANGPSWGLAIRAGFDEDEVTPSRDHLHMGLQYHMKDPEFIDEYGDEYIYLHFDRRYAPNGYTWSFRESDEYTRWGNAVPLSNDKTASECLDRFFEDTEKGELRKTECRETTNALIPTCEPLDSCVHKNVALVGDTGHHCDPLHGGGALLAARSGGCLGRAIASDDIQSYDRRWKNDILDTLQHRFIIRDVIVSLDNKGYDRVVRALQDFEFNTIDGDKEVPRLVWHVIKKDKSLFTQSAIKATRSFIRQKGLSL